MIKPKKNNVKMIHINKTGGTSVCEWLSPILEFSEPRDITGEGKGRSCHRIIEEFSDNFFYFTIVRNPYDRVASHFFQWSHQQNVGRGEESRWLSDDIKDLNDFVLKAFNNSSLDFIKEKYKSRHQPEYLLPCTYWIRDFNKVKIFKLEKLNELRKFFQEHFPRHPNIQNKIPISESTKTKGLHKYEHLYNESSKLIIREVFEDDFNNFGYKK